MPTSTRKKVIYCVDDDSSILAIYAVSFPSEKYDLVLFNNGVVCLECMKTIVPDLVFLDLNLPDLNGFGFLKIMVKLFPDIHIPVAIVSGIANVAAVKRSRELNVVTYLVKPLTPAILATFAEDYFNFRPSISNGDSGPFSECIRRQDEILFLDFEKYTRLDKPASFNKFFEKAAKTGLIIDLGKLDVTFVSAVENLAKLQQIYKNGSSSNKLKITAARDATIRYLRGLGKFIAADLFASENSAILDLRIGTNFKVVD